MKSYENFWVATLFRGILAMLIGSAILVVPDMAHTLLFLPMAVAIAILSLVIYGLVDSILVLISSFVTPLDAVRRTLRLQSLAGICLGALFCSILLQRIQLSWFLYLISVQAAITSYAEHSIAVHTSKAHGSRVCYVAAVVSLIAAFLYGFTAIAGSEALTSREITLLAYGYLVAFGITQTLMAGRILYVEHHPRPIASV